MFTLDGTFVRWIPCPGLQFPDDVDFAPSGDIIIADSVLCRVSVLSADGSRVIRHFGSDGDSDGMFLAPTALATVQDTLYILDMRAHRVQVFQ